MSFQKLEKFAKFLRFYYVSGDFDDGQIIYDDKYYSQINSSSENSKIKDLAHELAHFILSNNSNYRKLNFGLDLPGRSRSKEESNHESMTCVLGCMIMSYFGSDSKLIYEELVYVNLCEQKEIDDIVSNLIEQNVVTWMSESWIFKSEKFKNDENDYLPEYLIIPNLFKVNISVLKRR